MLMGHSYLIAPAMSLTPLLRLLAALASVRCSLRMAVAWRGLWLWTAEPGAGTLETETLLWLPVRWGLGFVGAAGARLDGLADGPDSLHAVGDRHSVRGRDLLFPRRADRAAAAEQDGVHPVVRSP